MFNLTFLNTIFLAGIAAAAIPILIHLLQRRRLKRVEFSDLRFLTPLNQRRMRSLTLRRLLLLALRVAIVVLAAVALARPSVRGGISRLLPTHARTSLLLLVDTSYSMRAEGEHGTSFEAAKAIATRLVDVAERGDQVNLMTFDTAPHPQFETAVHDLALVRNRIAALAPGHGGTRFGPALQAALAALASTNEPNRELYVISDFAGADLDSLRTDLRAVQGETRILWVPVGVESFVNVSVDAARVPPGAVLLGEPVRLGVTVRNHSPDAPADCNLQVELAGKPKGEASLRLAGGAQQTQEFTVVPTDAEAATGVVRKRIDRLPEDDVRYFVLPVLAQLHVLLVRGAGDAGGAFYVARALAPAPGGRSPLALTEVDAARLGNRDLEGVQVVVVAADAAPSGAQAQLLVEHVRNGGGLLLLSGARATADAVNRQILERLGNARIRGIVEQPPAFVNLADLRPAGILAGFATRELRALEAVKFTRYAELVAGGGARSVLGFSGGVPALVEGEFGDGKYMLAGFDAALDGSDLPVSTMFLPLLHRSVVYLAGETGRQKLEYTVGERIEVQVPIGAPAASGAPGEPAPRPAGQPTDAADSRSFTVTTPDGHTEAVVAHDVGRMAIATYENTGQPGHYVFSGLGRRLVRAVNVDGREADLRPVDRGKLADALGVEITGTIDAPEDVA